VLHSPGEVEVGENPIHYLRCIGKAKDEFWTAELFNSFHHEGVAHCNPVHALEAGVEILATANLNYESGKQKESLIIEMARDVNRRWISLQPHPEVLYKNHKPSQIVLQKFKELIR